MGFTKNWKQMTACRILLGLLEAGKRQYPVHGPTGDTNHREGYFPGCVYLLSSWYARCKFILDVVRLSGLTMVRRRPKEIFDILPHRLCGLGLGWYSRLRTDADGRDSRNPRLEMDIYHGGSCM